MLGYRAVFTAEDRPDRVLDQVQAQFRTWLRTKTGDQYDDSLVEWGVTTEFSPLARALLVSDTDESGVRSVRATLTEHNEVGRWTTTLTATAPLGSDPWIWLDVDGPDRTVDGGERQWTSTSRLAMSLLDVLNASDGAGELTRRPRPAFEADLNHLVDVVCDPGRRGLAFLAARPADQPAEEWSAEMTEILRETVGLSCCYLLDPDLVTAFNNEVGAAHALTPGALRSYASGADPASPVDAQRHRLHPLSHLESDENRREMRLVLGWQARRVTIHKAIPPQLASLDSRLERATNKLALRPAASLVASVPAPRSAPPESAEAGAVHESELRMDDLAVDVDYLRAELAEVRQELEDEQREHLMTQVEIQNVLALNTDLRVELARLGLGDLAWAEQMPRQELLPTSFKDVLDRLEQGELAHIQFRGDREPALQLDGINTNGHWANKTWAALQALNDYAEAKATQDFSGSMDSYLRNPPAGGRTISVQRHARDESEEVKVNPAYCGPRMLDVPGHIDVKGKVFMGAHVKITQYGKVSPRMHYHDATAQDGTIYIGYIGRHLPTGRSL